MSRRRKHTDAILLSLLLILSVIGTGTIGLTAAQETPQFESIDSETKQDPNDVQIDPALEGAEGTVQVLLLFEQTSVDPEMDEKAAIRHLKQHAAETRAQSVTQLESRTGVDVQNTFWIVNAVAISVDTDTVKIDELAAVNGVKSIVKSREYTVPETTKPEPSADSDVSPDDTTYGLDQIRAPRVWDELGTRGDGAKIAVLDTGVDITHPDIELYTEDPSDPTYPGGWAEFDDSGNMVPGSEPRDSHYHGTHTSATAMGGASSGTAIGVAPEADLIHGMVIPGGSGSTEGVIGGVQWAVEEDADVASLSLGAGCGLFGPVYSDAWIPVVENARSLGTAFVSSSGNSGQGCVGSPGNDYHSFSIGASDSNEDIADFSSGAIIDKINWENPPADWPDRFVKPDVSAPGVDVLSAEPGGGYQELSGTSMAAPHVAGAVALMRSANPDASVAEIENALESTAEKPDDWDAPENEKDTRYGKGIIDAYAAVDEMIFIPESELGDVDESGSVTVQDVRLTQKYLAGQNPSNFNPNLADMDRDGTVTYADLQLLQRKVQGTLDEGEIDVSNLSAPGEAEQGETVNVTVDLENIGEEGALEEIELHVAQNETDLGNGDPISTTPVDMAPDGVDDPVDRPHETTVTFQVDTSNLPGGTVHYGVFSENDSESDQMTILGSFFDVSNLQATDEIEQGETLTVHADVANMGNQQDTQTVEYRFDDLENPVRTKNVTLGVGESTAVEFTVDTSGIDNSTYEHGVFTEDDSQTTNVTVLEAFFDVSITDAPEEASAGETITVTATVENTGNATDVQTVEYETIPRSVDVAVVDVSDNEHGDDIASTLEEHLDTDIYTVDVVTADELPGAMGEYDTFVVQRFGSDQVASDFLDELDDDQSVVYLDSYQGASAYAYADGVYRLYNVRGDPVERDASSSSSTPVTIDIRENHPLFTNVGEVGDSVEVFTGSTMWGSWFAEYSGTILADADYGSGSAGPAVAVNDDKNEVLLSAVGRDYFTDESDFTEEGDLLLANSVAYLSGFGSAANGEERTQDETTANVTLAPGERETVEFAHTLEDEIDPSIDWLHVVSSEDDQDESSLDITIDRGNLTGTVTDSETGEPVENATVTIDVDIGDGDYTAVTDGNGEYEIENVPSGTHNSTVSADGYDEVTDTVTVPVDDTTTANFELDPTPGTISGTVTASDTGTGVANVTVAAEDNDGNVHETTTNENGSYSLGVPAGMYVVNVAGTPGDYRPEEIVSVAPGETVDGVDFTVEPRDGAIEGYVINAAGIPVEGATVVDADQGAFNVTTDENGYYRIEGLDRGTYALRTMHDRYPDSDITFTEVEANETTTRNLTLGTFFEVSNLSAPSEAEQGEGITVSATVTNVGEREDTRTVFYFPPGTNFGSSVLLESQSELSERVTLDGGESTTVEFSYEINPDRAVGDYEHGISADEVASTNITVTEDEPTEEASFTVTRFDAPTEVNPGEQVTVSATIGNIGNASGTQTVEYHLAGTARNTSDVTLDAGENTTVEFTVTMPSDTGSYEHGVATDDDQHSTSISVVESDPDPAYFRVSDVNGPAEVTQGKEITVSATLTNTGDEAATQTIWLFFMSSSSTVERDLGAQEMVALYKPRSAKQVTLAGGRLTTVEFTYSVDESTAPGEYEFAVSSLQETKSGFLTVLPAGNQTVPNQGSLDGISDTMSGYSLSEVIV
ncbi:S8 family serine peptidase [Haladaptatus caseinilyticus]|uniref:S8 family serine peptidase n=1 Tax=Haladaptatus caseinilyticus TaxID=2993314 RepID=UPI00224B80AE|nr:S8 family serine peptidase [Haladaptatus caseinilyticus]